MKDLCLLRYSMGPSELTWAEIGDFLKECWWMVAFFVFVFGLRAYLLRKEQKMEMEEQEEQEEQVVSFRIEPQTKLAETEDSSPRPKIDSYTKMKLMLSLLTLVIVFSTTSVSVNDLMFLGVVLVLAVAAFLSYLYIGKR